MRLSLSSYIHLFECFDIELGDAVSSESVTLGLRAAA